MLAAVQLRCLTLCLSDFFFCDIASVKYRLGGWTAGCKAPPAPSAGKWRIRRRGWTDGSLVRHRGFTPVQLTPVYTLEWSCISSGLHYVHMRLECKKIMQVVCRFSISGCGTIGLVAEVTWSPKTHFKPEGKQGRNVFVFTAKERGMICICLNFGIQTEGFRSFSPKPPTTRLHICCVAWKLSSSPVQLNLTSAADLTLYSKLCISGNDRYLAIPFYPERSAARRARQTEPWCRAMSNTWLENDRGLQEYERRSLLTSGVVSWSWWSSCGASWSCEGIIQMSKSHDCLVETNTIF